MGGFFAGIASSLGMGLAGVYIVAGIFFIGATALIGVGAWAAYRHFINPKSKGDKTKMLGKEKDKTKLGKIFGKSKVAEQDKQQGNEVDSTKGTVAQDKQLATTDEAVFVDDIVFGDEPKQLDEAKKALEAGKEQEAEQPATEEVKEEAVEEAKEQPTENNAQGVEEQEVIIPDQTFDVDNLGQEQVEEPKQQVVEDKGQEL